MPLADRALVVGINRYPGIGNLQGPENDANDFFAWVTSPDGGNVDPKNAKLIRSSDFPAAAAVKDELPEQKQINDFFTEVDDAATENNVAGQGARAGRRLWMFFSGHGFAPSLEDSCVLMANATVKQVHNIAAARWANLLHVGGWFDEILLFQDACRNRIPAAKLNEPFIVGRNASIAKPRLRFYAFSSKDQKLSKELPCPDGKVRGVFAATLLDGLRGAARDSASGAITARTLKTYLQDNMRNRLSDADKANPEIAQEPDVRDPDILEIVPAPAAPVVERYTVTITLPAAGMTVTLQDGSFRAIATPVPAPQVLSISLPRGLYRLVVVGAGERLFQVTGPGTGAQGAIDVRF
jgi:uncharacterized caspase-like protein